MSVRLLDVQAGFGGSAKGRKDFFCADDLLAEMGRVQIEKALVRIAPDEVDADIAFSNSYLFEACEKNDALIPCPVVVPSGSDDFPPEDEQAEALVSQGEGAAFIRPEHDGWSLAEWASAGLFCALEARRTPVLCLERHVPIEKAADIARRHPDLPVIVAEVGYRSLRILLPMLEAFPNTYLSIGSNFTIHRALERLVEKVGAERLLFGSGLPEIDPLPAVTMLMYADITDDEKALIGAGNFERLIEGVRR